MEKAFEIITSAFQSLWKFKDYGNTLEIVTPVATTNDMFVSVFITKRNNDYIATDGGWIDSGMYECEVDWKGNIFKKVGLHYLENFGVLKTEAKGRTFYYKRVNKIELLPNIVFDMSNFINAIVSSSTIKFTADREEIIFRKNVRGFMIREFGEERFEYDKPISENTPIKFNAIERNNNGIKLINFVSGSNSSYYANSLCRSNTNFQMIIPFRERYMIKRTITLLDDTKPSVINSPQVQTYYNYLMETRTDDNKVILWSQKRDFAEAIQEEKRYA